MSDFAKVPQSPMSRRSQSDPFAVEGCSSEEPGPAERPRHQVHASLASVSGPATKVAISATMIHERAAPEMRDARSSAAPTMTPTVVQVLMRCAEVLFTLLSLTDLPR